MKTLKSIALNYGPIWVAQILVVICAAAAYTGGMHLFEKASSGVIDSTFLIMWNYIWAVIGIIGGCLLAVAGFFMLECSVAGPLGDLLDWVESKLTKS